jgi:hypothetical protein
VSIGAGLDQLSTGAAPAGAAATNRDVTAAMRAVRTGPETTGQTRTRRLKFRSPSVQNSTQKPISTG